MDSRRVAKAAKSNPVNSRKITIKRVTSLPKDKKSEPYNPFSCVSEENSPQQSPNSDKEINIYDPFEPTESDEEKLSPERNYCNPEPPEQAAEAKSKEDTTPTEKINNETSAAVKVEDETPEEIDNNAKISKDGRDEKHNLFASLQSEDHKVISEDIFMDLDEDSCDSVPEMLQGKTKVESNKADDLKVEFNQTKPDVVTIDVEQAKSEYTSHKDLASATDDNLEEAPLQRDELELHVHPTEVSSKHKKHKKHSKQHEGDLLSSKLDKKNLPGTKTVQKEKSQSHHREKKAKHSNKDKKDKDMRKSLDSDIADKVTEQYDIEEFEVIEQEEEEGEIIEPKIITKRKNTSKTRTTKPEDHIKSTVESDGELVENPRHEKKSRRDSDVKEPKSKYKKNKRKSVDYNDENFSKVEMKHEKQDEKRKSSSHERKGEDGRKKQKNDHVSDQQKSVERHREYRRKSANPDKELDYRDKKASRDNYDDRNSNRHSRHNERKADKERDYCDDRKGENDAYRDVSRQSIHLDDRKEKERESYHEKKRKDKYHVTEKGEGKSKHRHDDFKDDLPTSKERKIRKSPSIERHRKRQNDRRTSRSSDGDSQKKKKYKTSSVEQDLSSNSVSTSSSHRRHSTYKSKALDSQVSRKSKERQRRISWRSVDDNINDSDNHKKHSQQPDLNKSKDTRRGRHESEGDYKSKRRKVSHPDESQDTFEHSTKHSSHSKKSKHKHSKNKRSSSVSSVEDLNKSEKKASKHKKKKKKRRSSIESANSSLQPSETKTGEGSRISTDEYSFENDTKTEHGDDKLCEEAVSESSAKSPLDAFYEELDIIDSPSPLPDSDHDRQSKKKIDVPVEEVHENSATSPLDTSSSSPSKDLHCGSQISNDAPPTLPDSSSQSPMVSAKEDMKSHQNIKESLSFAEEFVERSRKRWKEKKSSIASSNDSPQLCILSDSESKSNHRNLVEIESDALNNTNGNVMMATPPEIPGLDISKSPVGDTDFRLHDFDARRQDVADDIFEDSHQSASTQHQPDDNGISDGADNSTERLADTNEAYEPEMSPADMVLDSENSDSIKGANLEEKLDSSKPIDASIPNTASDSKNDNSLSMNNRKKALLNPTQILNRIGLNPQQHSAAQNAILSIAELSKHLHLDKVSDHLIEKTQKVKNDTPGDIESSAVELHNKDKKRGHLKKLKFKEQVIEEAKLAIKPYYESRQISKPEYKDILKKAVNKIYSSETTYEVNTVKIRRLIRRYIEKYQQKKTMKKDKSKAKVSNSPLAPHYQPLTSTSEGKAGVSYPLPFSKRESKKTYTLPDLPLPPPPPPPKR